MTRLRLAARAAFAFGLLVMSGMSGLAAEEKQTNEAPKQEPFSLFGTHPTFQLRGHGGAAILDGQSMSAFGFDGAILFPVSKGILLGPLVGYQWIDGTISKMALKGPPRAGFAQLRASVENIYLGARMAVPIDQWEFGLQAGVTIPQMKITKDSGPCRPSSSSINAPMTCVSMDKTIKHLTVAGPFAGVYVSHPIFSKVSVFAEVDYSYLEPHDRSGQSNVFLLAGIVLTLNGRDR